MKRTPFVRQYGTLSDGWGDSLWQKGRRASGMRRSPRQGQGEMMASEEFSYLERNFENMQGGDGNGRVIQHKEQGADGTD